MAELADALDSGSDSDDSEGAANKGFREVAGDDSDAEKRRATPPGNSQGNAPSARRELVATLQRLLNESLDSGDTKAARVAHRALGELLGDGATDAVVDLSEERAKRGKG